MGHFHNTFLSFAEGSCDPAKWKPYFLEYQPDVWDTEGDGVLQFHTDDDREYSLVIVHWLGLGFILQLACRNLTTNRFKWCKFSVSDHNSLAQFEERDDLQYPAGCFLSASDAWRAVEDFLTQPTQPSPRIEWVDDADIPWPE
jgi:hypothetical protein